MIYFLYQASNLKNEEEILLKKDSKAESEHFCDMNILEYFMKKISIL